MAQCIALVEEVAQPLKAGAFSRHKGVAVAVLRIVKHLPMFVDEGGQTKHCTQLRGRLQDLQLAREFAR